MGIKNPFNVSRKSWKSLFHLTLIAFIMVATLNTTSSVLGIAGAETTAVHMDDNNLQLVRSAAGIPYCDDNTQRTIGRRLLYITTLDGRLSALDATKSGKLHWSIPTGPGGLISSSIHRLELTNNGQFVRMIPSLSGYIYKFDGESIDPIPITTEHLLSSSAKLSDDLVISGGKETRTYGVSVRTGQLLYECSMNGCINSTDDNNTDTAADYDGDDGNRAYGGEHDSLLDDVLVVRRQTQTVRAVESRTGLERWNFSVGQHEINMKKPAECHDRTYSAEDMAVLDLEIKVVVPEGLVCAFSKSNPNNMLWSYKFEYPIVSGWKMAADEHLEQMDMFGSAQWMWDNENNVFDMPIHSSPAIYLGMYDKQLYIQESITLLREIGDQSSLYEHLQSDSALPIISWRPVPASSNSLALIKTDLAITNGNGKLSTSILPKYDVDIGAIEGNELVPYDEGILALTAQSVLNASEYVNGNGFYLYANEASEKEKQKQICGEEEEFEEKKKDLKKNKDKDKTLEEVFNETNSSFSDDLGFSLDDVDIPVKVVILSLWFWWKEVVVIALTTAVLVNVFLLQRRRQEILVIERHVPVPTAFEATEQSTVALLGPTNGSSGSANTQHSQSQSESTNGSGENFSSRFLSDFDLVRCLGRGGFGVVFETKNKLDDCKYAVKRITLPNKKESRERVMREVKTLANCEHQNIVRYFQAWVETPPPGWQEDEDSKWLAQEMSLSMQSETAESTTQPTSASNPAPSRQWQVERKRQLISWMSSINDTDCAYEQVKNNDCISEDEDSCIVFRSESQSSTASSSVSAALKAVDERVSKNDNIDNNKTQKNAKKTERSDSIAIDVHSNSFDMSFRKNANKNIDYSQLSDSFQIEFVRPANDDDDAEDDGKNVRTLFSNGHIESSVSEINHKQITRRTSKKRQSSLEPENVLINIESSASSKALMPATPKPQQNKVYLYIQMQLCRKESLRDWLRDNRCDTRQNEVASIFHQIVDAVDYVHLKGLIHRDLKPSNIFFSQDGQIKIGDFGLVTDMSDIPNIVTKCGDKTGLPSCARHTLQVGTHLYMSPEQLLGEHYDFKVDIYSLGLIFFELLVYFGTEMERIKTLRGLRDGVYPSDFALKFPKEHDLLKLMLSKQPTERPATPELKMQLLDILEWPEGVLDESNPLALATAAVARRYSRSRTFSSSVDA